MGLDDASGDGEPETRTGRLQVAARCPGSLAAEADVEDAVELGLGDPAAFIAHQNLSAPRCIVGHAYANLDPTSLRGVPDRVRGQVRQRAVELGPVADHGHEAVDRPC